MAKLPGAFSNRVPQEAAASRGRQEESNNSTTTLGICLPLVHVCGESRVPAANGSAAKICVSKHGGAVESHSHVCVIQPSGVCASAKE